MKTTNLNRSRHNGSRIATDRDVVENQTPHVSMGVARNVEKPSAPQEGTSGDSPAAAKSAFRAAAAGSEEPAEVEIVTEVNEDWANKMQNTHTAFNTIAQRQGFALTPDQVKQQDDMVQQVIEDQVAPRSRKRAPVHQATQAEPTRNEDDQQDKSEKGKAKTQRHEGSQETDEMDGYTNEQKSKQTGKGAAPPTKQIKGSKRKTPEPTRNKDDDREKGKAKTQRDEGSQETDELDGHTNNEPDSQVKNGEQRQSGCPRQPKPPEGQQQREACVRHTVADPTRLCYDMNQKGVLMASQAEMNWNNGIVIETEEDRASMREELTQFQHILSQETLRETFRGETIKPERMAKLSNDQRLRTAMQQQIDICLTVADLHKRLGVNPWRNDSEGGLFDQVCLLTCEH